MCATAFDLYAALDVASDKMLIPIVPELIEIDVPDRPAVHVICYNA